MYEVCVCVCITVWFSDHVFVCTFVLASVSSVEYVFFFVNVSIRVYICLNVCGNNYTTLCACVCVRTHVYVSHCNPPPGESRKGLWVICELLFD